VRALGALGDLEVLALERTKVTDGGLVAIPHLRKLTDLMLAARPSRTRGSATWRPRAR
jgi:hypothetical protein